MSLCKYDTFENEAEMDMLIKKLQEKSIEYLNYQDPWDNTIKYPIKEG